MLYLAVLPVIPKWNVSFQLQTQRLKGNESEFLPQNFPWTVCLAEVKMPFAWLLFHDLFHTLFSPRLFLHTVRWLKGRLILILNRSRCFAPAQWTPASCGICDAGLTAPGYSVLYCSELRDQESTAGQPSLACHSEPSWVPLHPLRVRRDGWFPMGSIFQNVLIISLSNILLPRLCEPGAFKGRLFSQASQCSPFGCPVWQPILFVMHSVLVQGTDLVESESQHSILSWCFSSVHTDSSSSGQALFYVSSEVGLLLFLFWVFILQVLWTDSHHLLNVRRVLLPQLQCIFTQLVYMAFMWNGHPFVPILLIEIQSIEMIQSCLGSSGYRVRKWWVSLGGNSVKLPRHWECSSVDSIQEALGSIPSSTQTGMVAHTCNSSLR